jgi:hypothetical protein
VTPAVFYNRVAMGTGLLNKRFIGRLTLPDVSSQAEE